MADQAIHRMDTTPPPEGEDDAYNAATKIGPMARGLVEALMAKAQADENSSMPPPPSATRRQTIAKPDRLPPASGVTPRFAPSAPPVVHLYDEVDDGDLLDPTALFGPAGDPALAPLGFPASTRSVINQVDGPAPASRAFRSDAEWTKAPTLLHMPVIAVPPLPLAPLLEPAAITRRRSTLAVELAVFAGAFLLVAIPAALAYLMWFR